MVRASKHLDLVVTVGERRTDARRTGLMLEVTLQRIRPVSQLVGLAPATIQVVEEERGDRWPAMSLIAVSSFAFPVGDKNPHYGIRLHYPITLLEKSPADFTRHMLNKVGAPNLINRVVFPRPRKLKKVQFHLSAWSIQINRSESRLGVLSGAKVQLKWNDGFL